MKTKTVNFQFKVKNFPQQEYFTYIRFVWKVFHHFEYPNNWFTQP